MGWKKGPLPPGTYHWGGVVPICPACRGTGYKIYTPDRCPDCSGTGAEVTSGFYFADFHGDHVKVDVLEKDGDYHKRTIRTLKPDEVAWYNNALDLPPTGAKGRTPDQEQ
jgi:hypothetical protein